MAEKQTFTRYDQSFESIKHVSSNGVESWRARDLMLALDYGGWENFEKVIDKAQEACENGGYQLNNHFLARRKMVGIGSGARRIVADYWLSRTACYLIAMNGDPIQKPVIAAAQIYFAYQTIRQENFEKHFKEKERLKDYRKTIDDSSECEEEALARGLCDIHEFHDAGIRGLYGGFDETNLKLKKNVPAEDTLHRYMGSEELALNAVQSTQTKAKLKRENIQGGVDVNRVFENEGKNLRKYVLSSGGTPPEDLAVESDIHQLADKPEHRSLAAGMPQPLALESGRIERPRASPMRPGAKWPETARVQVLGVHNGLIQANGLGCQNFDNLAAAREVFHDLDIYKEGPRFTAAIGNPEKDPMRFETWKAAEIYSEE